eukprot:4143629-Prymnesium_polylepis.2
MRVHVGVWQGGVVSVPLPSSIFLFQLPQHEQIARLRCAWLRCPALQRLVHAALRPVVAARVLSACSRPCRCRV